MTLPVGPGVTFDVSEPHDVYQDEFLAAVELSGPGAVVISFPDQASGGEPLATVDDVVGAVERNPDITATVVGTREVSGDEATEVNISSSVEPSPDTPPMLQRSALPDSRWSAPPEGTLWIMETPDGLAVITAEWFERAGMEPTRALAAEILDSIVIGGRSVTAERQSTNSRRNSGLLTAHRDESPDASGRGQRSGRPEPAVEVASTRSLVD